MIDAIVQFIMGSHEKKKLRNYQNKVKEVHKKKTEFASYTLDDVKKQTEEWKKMFLGLDFQNEKDGKQIIHLLKTIEIDAYALIMHTCSLLYNKEFVLPNGKTIVWDKIPYDVQIMGAFALHDAQIAEMKTGEGKTLVATFPAYLNALTGNPVHIITVNDYLAQRDAQEMGILYNALGLTVGTIIHAIPPHQRYHQYHCDIVYATNNEIVFDYLRDNMVVREKDQVMSPLFFAIIDEVDSILIDEARTPLIISMPDNEPTSKYIQFAELSKRLQEGIDYKVDEKQKTAVLTEEGVHKVEKILGVDNIYISDRYNDLHHIENALKAQAVYKKDRDYIVMNNEVLIIDEHTGRILHGRRYSEGLHQAIEAKEGVPIQRESRTLASITFQNYFRLYWKLAGMTGTAKTEEEEFYKIYGLETIVIPTNRPMIRVDLPDLIFKNEKGKFDYVIKQIEALHKKGQPVLVGTISVEKSEYLSQRLKAIGIPHNVLNAKNHEREAEIIAQAGNKGSVTIATNMAGRGTDIKLGPGVKELGGLYIIGTEKHETRRIDNQLRGRAGRQGDPGTTQFLVSPDDEIMRIFGGDKIFSRIMGTLASYPDDEPLAQSKLFTAQITSVQKQIEGYYFDMRKHVLEYDDVMNKHREIIYAKRKKILKSENIHEDVKKMVLSQVTKYFESLLDTYKESSQYDIVEKKMYDSLGISLELTQELFEILLRNEDERASYLQQKVGEKIATIQGFFPQEEDFFQFEREIVLQSIDELWMRHIDSMTKLRDSVAFEGYAQKNPLIVYKEKAFEKFENLIGEIEYKTTKALFSASQFVEIKQAEIADTFLAITHENIPPLSQTETTQEFPPSTKIETGKGNEKNTKTPKQGGKQGNTPPTSIRSNTSSGKHRIRV